jgi:LAO/AO transport system kinase
VNTEEAKEKSALIVNEGIEQPPNLNTEALDKIRSSKPKLPDVGDLFEGIRNKDRSRLSQAITLLESSRPEHQSTARQLIERCLPHTGQSIRIGITGVPGVGKSTFIEAFGSYLTSTGHKVAVLAIDPSSQRSKGSILGDKTRMERLAADPSAFIRPSPSSGELGGVARKTRETIALCEAAGYDIIIVETVGVGQSETAVHGMVDFFLLLMLAGAGDELQGIKRGIMELCDAIVINKADGDNRMRADLACREYANALHLFPPAPSGWVPRSTTCSSTEEQGIPEIWRMIEEYRQFSQSNGYFSANRQRQLKLRFAAAIEDILKSRVMQAQGMTERFSELEKEVEAGKISPFTAAEEFLFAAEKMRSQKKE